MTEPRDIDIEDPNDKVVATLAKTVKVGEHDRSLRLGNCLFDRLHDAQRLRNKCLALFPGKRYHLIGDRLRQLLIVIRGDDE